MKVALFDYGAGNLHSLKKALEAGGGEVRITQEWKEALSRDALVLPGVGSFGAAVRAMGNDGPRILDALGSGHPCLGICLGMQLFFQRSEEGEGDGIGLAAGSVQKFETRVVPQMGWNDVTLGEDPLFRGLTGLVAYYANSYVCAPEDPSSVIATSRHEDRSFPAGIRIENSVGVQFHPERIIKNFLEEI
ncbi:MAG: imidazole glycerol phosphate synthase subunit HisH [Planctomycetota bacterium]